MTDPLARLSVFATHNTTQAQRFITPEELAQMAQNPTTGPKDGAALIVPFESDGKTGPHAQAAMFAAVVIDHDNDNKTEADIRHLYGPEGLNVCYLAFTSASHQQPKNKEPALNRWKVVVPFASPVDAEAAARISVGIAYSLASDPAQARKQQGFYAPNKVAADAPYIEITDTLGEPWEWLQSDDADSVFIQEAAQGWADFQAAEEAKASAARAKPRTSALSAGAGIVERIQAAYGLAYLLEQNGYKRKGRGLYLSPFSSTGAAGVKLLERDGKQVAYSHHGEACPLSSLNHDGHSLDVVDVLCSLKYGGDYQAMIAAEAKALDPDGNRQRQREHMQQKAEAEVAAAFYAVDAPAPAGNLAGLLSGQPAPESEGKPPAPANMPAPQHPLTRFVDLGRKPEPPNWLLPGFIAEGLVMIAGGHGVGKTTTLLPLAMAVAGIHPPEYELAPEHWRHVVYITEDIHQAARIVAGYANHLDWPAGSGVWDKIQERLHIVEARRGTPTEVAKAGPQYRQQFTRTVTTTGLDGKPRTVELLPLVVIDTIAATIHLENENDNAEASATIAKFKQGFAGLPIWFVGHTAKANLSRSDVITARGASAFEADANQVLYLVKEDKDNTRWLARGKTRFESPWPELEIHSHSTETSVTNRFGAMEPLTLRWSIAMPPDTSRAQQQEQAQAERVERGREAMRAEILAAVREAFDNGQRLNRSGACNKAQGHKQTKLDAIQGLLSDDWLYEVEIPRGQHRLNRPSFLVALTAEERDNYQATGQVPEYKLHIPPSWKKQPKPEPEPVEQVELETEQEAAS